MKKKIKYIIATVLKKFFQVELIILNYHQVTQEYSPQFHSPGTWTQSMEFEKTLIYLKNNFNIISLKTINENIPKNSVAITFDDGFKSIEENVIPLLQKYNIPATFFVNTAYIGTNKASWAAIGNYFFYSKELKDKINFDYLEKKYILRNTTDCNEYNILRNEIECLHQYLPENFSFFTNFEFLRNLNCELFTIGLHGHEHQRHSMLSDEIQNYNITENYKILAKLPNFIPFYAIPYGKPFDWNNHTLDLCKKLSLKILSAHGGINKNTKFMKIINRIPADSLNIKDLIENLYIHKIKKFF